jgi:hypothetical protein
MFVHSREIMFLQALHDHENIIKLQKVIKADNDCDIYLVFEHMGTYSPPLSSSIPTGLFLKDDYPNRRHDMLTSVVTQKPTCTLLSAPISWRRFTSSIFCTNCSRHSSTCTLVRSFTGT